MRINKLNHDVLYSLYFGIGGLGILLLVARVYSVFGYGDTQLYLTPFQWFDLLFLAPVLIYKYGKIVLPFPKIWPYLSAISAGYFVTRVTTLLLLPDEWPVIIFSAAFGAATIFFTGKYLSRSAKPKPLMSQNHSNIEPGRFPLYLDRKMKFFIPTKTLNFNIQCTGGTGTGKTYHVMKGMIEQDIEVNRLGVLIYDVKSNMVNDILFYCKKAGRLGDFKYFDLLRQDRSMTWNPLANGTADDIANRIFCALYPESDNANQYYSDLANSFLSNLITLLKLEHETITFMDVYQATSELDSFRILNDLCLKHKNTIQANYFYQNWLSTPKKDRQERLSGLINKLQRFCTREWAPLLNTRTPDIDLSKIFKNNNVFLFAIASQKYGDDSKALSIMMMMEISQQIADRASTPPEKPFRVYLDEFYNMAYPQFVNILNKARESQVNFFLAHQSFADLTRISTDFAQQVSINTRTKIMLTQDDSEMAKFYSELLGTDEVQTETHSYDTSQLITTSSGMTVKDEHKFRVNPNKLKELKEGEAIIRTTFPEVGLVLQKINLRLAEETPKNFSFENYLPILNNLKKPLESVFNNANKALLAIRDAKDAKAKETPDDTEKLKKLQTDLIREQRRAIPPKINKTPKPADETGLA